MKKFQESNPTWRVFNDAGEISSGYRVPFDDIDWKDRIGDYLSRDMKSEIEADPMSYVNAKDMILRDYANKVITGEPVDYESVFRNRYEYDSSIPYSNNDSNIEELKKIKRDYIKNIDDF